ncbi:MAG: hypothetical protein O7E53_04525 [Alphaproteobacteria bacterium]|nr:hypothetical protein [Alphaproteobacteria bacterium]
MFGFSLQKLLVLGLIIAAIWYGFKWVGKLDRDRKERLRQSRDGAASDGDGQDLAECTLCGTYVTARLSRCPDGRADCPSVEG